MHPLALLLFLIAVAVGALLGVLAPIVYTLGAIAVILAAAVGLDSIPVIRTWLDFYGLDLGPTTPERPAQAVVRVTPPEQLPRTSPAALPPTTPTIDPGEDGR